MSVSAWLAVVFLSLPLAVGRPGVRSVPLDGREASAIRRFIRQIVAVGAASWIVAASFYMTWIGEGLPRLLLIFAGLVICAISLRALARIRSRLSGFGRIWHILAVFSVFGLGAAWIGQLLFGGRPPFRPTLLTVLVLAALPAADGMAALLIDRLKQRLVRTGEASRRIYAPAADLEDEELAARRADWRALEAGALIRAETRPDGRLLVYRGGEDTARVLEGLIEAERKCCSFLDFRVEADEDEVRVTVTMPPEARPMAIEMGIVGTDRAPEL